MHALSFIYLFISRVLYSLKFWWGSYNFDSYFKSNSSFDFKIHIDNYSKTVIIVTNSIPSQAKKIFLFHACHVIKNQLLSF